MENKEKSGLTARNTLKSYIQKVAVEHSTDAFARATSRTHEAFKPEGTIFVPSLSNKIPDQFQEMFRRNLLSFNILTPIELVGSNHAGFISTTNCVRITFSQENIVIQLKISTPFSLEDIAKIGVAATKSVTYQKNISLGEFSNDSLFYTIQPLLKKEEFLIEAENEKKINNEEIMQKGQITTRSNEEKPLPALKKSNNTPKPLEFFSRKN